MRSLGEIASFIMGQAPAGKDCNKDGRGTPFVKAGEFGNERPVIREWTTDPKKFAKDGDVLVCVVGATCGKINLGIDCAIGRSVAAIRPDTAWLDQRYLHHFMSGKVLELRRGSVGAAQTVISREMLSAIPIPLPPLDEQKRIVAVLDEAFEGLDRARANAEANLADARELFESYLDKELSTPQSDWRSASLGSLCRRVTVGHVGPMADRYVESGIPFLRSQNIRPFQIDLTGVKYIDDKFMSELKKSELRPGDVAIVRTGYPGTCAVIPEELELANCADIVIARLGPELDPHFMTMLLNSRYGKAHVAEVSVGAAQKHFNVAAAKSAVFPIPPISVQHELVDKSMEFRARCSVLEKSFLEKGSMFDSLRQSLLQKAFSGELG